MELKSNEEKITQALLVSVDTGGFDAEASLDELFELVKSAGAEPVLSVCQKLSRPETATYVGSGKLKEITEICQAKEIDLLVFDCELTPSQIISPYSGYEAMSDNKKAFVSENFYKGVKSEEVVVGGKLKVLGDCGAAVRLYVCDEDQNTLEYAEFSSENLGEIFTYDFSLPCGSYIIVAEADGKVVGAVWTRIMDDYGHVDDDIPSFAISLYKKYRGHGIGTRLMKEMLSLLKKQGFKKASLAVQKANYAVKMYKDVGFKTVDENDEEYIMVCEL